MRKTLRPKVHINKLYRLREKLDRRLGKILNAQQELDHMIRVKLEEEKKRALHHASGTRGVSAEPADINTGQIELPADGFVDPFLAEQPTQLPSNQ